MHHLSSSARIQPARRLNSAGSRLKSTMLSYEHWQLDQLRAKQQREIEVLLQNQKLEHQKRQRDSEKQQMERKKDQRRMQKNRHESELWELRSREREEHRKNVYDREVELMQSRRDALIAKEEMSKKQQKEQAAIRKAKARQNELRLKEQQIQFRQETKARFDMQEQKIEVKREKLENKHRDASEHLEMQKQHEMNQTVKKREMNQARIFATLIKDKEIQEEKRHKHEIKEQKTFQKRMQFEAKKKFKQEQLIQTVISKQQQAEQVKLQDQRIQQMVKNRLLQKQQNVNEKMVAREHQKSIDRENAQKENKIKDRYRKIIKQKNDWIEEQRKDNFRSQQESAEQKLQRTLSRNQQQAQMLRTVRDQKRQERQHTVELTMQEQEQERIQLMGRINDNYDRCSQLKEGRQQFWNIRKQMRIETDRQKMMIIKKLDTMKQKGMLDSQAFQQLEEESQLGQLTTTITSPQSPKQYSQGSFFSGRSYPKRYSSPPRYPNTSRTPIQMFASSHRKKWQFDSDNVLSERDSITQPYTRSSNNLISRASKTQQMLSQSSKSQYQDTTGSQQQSKGKNVPRKGGDTEVRQQLVEMRLSYNNDLMQILEKEQIRESERERMIQQISNPQEAQQMEQLFVKEREEASRRIKEASAIHEKNIQTYIQLQQSLS